jgi:trk system potassium uptake protein TrkA
MLKELPVPKKSVLIAITRNDSVLIPKGDTQILVDDDILFLTDEASRKELKEIFG